MKTHCVRKISKGTAVVSARRLRRVVIEPSGKIVKELCPIREAKAYASSFNTPPHRFKAVVQKYPQ